MCYRSALGHEYKSNKTDNAGSSTISLSSQPMPTHHLGQNEDAIGIVHDMLSPFSSPNASLKIPASPTNTGCWSRSCQLLMPITSPLGAPNCLDLKDHQPIQRWSSLNKLSCMSDKSCTKTDYLYNPDSHGSLDRGLYGYRKERLGSNMDLYLSLSSSLPCSNLYLPGAGHCYPYNYDIRSTDMETDKHLSTALSSSVKHNSLDINYSALPESQRGRLAYGLSVPKEADHQTDRCSPVQPTVLTQMWLSEQMQYRTKAEHGYEAGQISGIGTEYYGCPHWQEPGNQMLMGASLPANTLVKVKEGLLRKRELEIDRQKQQILQLHVLIRKNELRVQHVLQSQRGCADHPYALNNKVSMKTSGKQPFTMLHCTEGFGRRLEMAELEIIHLNEFFKQATQKYTEDVRKLEEKIRTRNRYISSLKKKCQRESEQNREKQQRIETLEKYLSDLPTLDKVHTQTQQHKEKQQKAKDLEKKISWLQKNLEDGCALMKEKDIEIEMQAKREKELIASIHSLQQKVQQCLDDGVRLPLQDLKQLEVENTQLMDQQDHSSWLIDHQKEQIDRLTLQLLTTSTRLQKQTCPSRQQQFYPERRQVTHVFPQFPTEKLQDADEGRLVQTLSHPEVGQLLKEMSLCLPDLQALCIILAERAEGKEPNLSLLLGMKSLSVPTEDNDCRVMEEMKFKLLQVGQLRRDIEELRKSISNHCA